MKSKDRKLDGEKSLDLIVWRLLFEIFRKPFLFALMAVIISIMLTSFVNAQVSILGVSQADILVPGQQQNLVATIESNSTIVNALIEIDAQNRSMNLNAIMNSASYSWIPSGVGIKRYGIFVINSEGETAYVQGFFQINDATPPIINSLEPSGSVTNENVVLKATTNEFATCKYGNSPASYDSLPFTFDTSGFNLHQKSIILSEGINQFYVACIDQNGNRNDGQLIIIDFNSPPKAQIIVSREENFDWLGARTYDISLKTSEPVIQSPSLSLNCAGRSFSIPLEGQNYDWKGFLKINEVGIDCSGEFIYAGTDLRGVVGREITGGKLAIVNTMILNSPKNIRAENAGNHIKLIWDVDELQKDMIKSYKLYRSTTGNTGQGDFVASSSQNVYSDFNVKNKVGYFYKISILSKSGMEGVLSEEIFIQHSDPNASLLIIDKESLDLITLQISKMQNYVDKMNSFADTIKEDELKNNVAIALGIYSKIDEQSKGVELLIGETKVLQSIQSSPAEIDSKLKNINSRFNNLKKGGVTEINILSDEVSEPVLTEEEYIKLAKEFASVNLLNDDQMNFYLEASKILYSGTRISRSVIEYSVELEEEKSDEGLLVSNTVLATPSGFESVFLQEVLPRGSVKFSEIEFLPEAIDINSNGPIWKLSALQNKKISYLAGKNNQDELLNSKAVVFPYVEEVLVKYSVPQDIKDNNEITGDVVGSGFGSDLFGKSEIIIYSVFGSMILILLGYYVYTSGVLVSKNSKINVMAVPKAPVELQRMSKDKEGGLKSFEVAENLLQTAIESLHKGDLQNARESYSSARNIYLNQLSLSEKIRINDKMNKVYEEVLSKLI